MLHSTGRLNPIYTRFSGHNMNEDHPPLYENAESSHSAIYAWLVNVPKLLT